MKAAFLGISLLAGLPALAQQSQPPVEDFKPSTLNQPGQQYPQVNSERRVRYRVVAPQAWRGMVAALTIAWARSLGEFGPILVFAGATRMRTEVLSTTVFLELSVGQLEAAVAVSLLMVVAAMLVLGVVRLLGTRVLQ